MGDVKLTAAQQAVVENRGGALLVSAAAGSGKTKVLVDRLLSMILDEADPKNIDDFLMITYTKAAASELRGKILSAMQERLSQMPGHRHLQRQLTRIYLADISTVHSFCANILRENAFRMDIPADFRVGEELECKALRQRAMDQTIMSAYEQMDPDFQAFVDTLGSGRDDRALADIVAGIYDKAMSHRDPEAWMVQCAAQLQTEGVEDFGSTVWGKVLLDDLHCFLEDCIGHLERVCAMLTGDPALEKSYLPGFKGNIEQLLALRNCGTWDETVSVGLPDFGRLKPVRKCDDMEAKETAQAIRKYCTDELKKRMRCFKISSREALEEVAAIAPAIRGALVMGKEFGERYRKEKRRRHILDFGDLEHEALRLLYGKQGTRPTVVAGEIGMRYHEILVDEYQDSNEVQDAIFRAISRNEKNLFMVGDVKQSIYRFRLADPGIFLQKYRDYLPYEQASDGEPRKILLSENFRSRGEILRAVNDVFYRSMSDRTGDLNYGEEEALRAGLVFPEVPYVPVELHIISEDFVSTGEEKDPEKAEVEAAFTAQRIAALLREETMVNDKGVLRPARPDDIAILLRSPRTAAPYYISALQELGVLCFCDTGEDILRSTELQVLSSLLEVIENPHQDIPLLAVLASPLYGFDASELAMIRGRNHRKDFYDRLCASENPRAVRFCRELDEFRATAESDGLQSLMDTILLKTDAMSVFGAMKGGAIRKNNIQTFRSVVAAHGQNGGNLVSFVRSLKDLRETGMPLQGGEAQGAVTLTSIHKSKGLEYPIVILAGLSKAFNMEDLRKPVLVHPELGIASNVTDLRLKMRYPSVAKQALSRLLRAEAVSEELRVLYVAMTRAKDMLIMSYCADYMETKLRKMVQLRNCSSPVQLAAQASCEGDWVLAEALGRTEAGEIHNRVGKPVETAVSDVPWVIRWHSASELMSARVQPVDLQIASVKAMLPERETLIKMLDYSYPWKAISELPSKLTATQLKGRRLDDEISENTAKPVPAGKKYRKPVFLAQEMTAAEAGTVVHLAMQFLRYECCTSQEGIEAELDRLVQEEYLTQAQREAVDAGKILRFFESDLGKRVLRAPELKREFKFSVLMDAGEISGCAAGEKILLQGVTDCCLIEEDGVTVVDFKTDNIKAGTEQERAEFYRGQLEGYSSALSRIFERPVQERILYFFATDTAISL